MPHLRVVFHTAWAEQLGPGSQQLIPDWAPVDRHPSFDERHPSSRSLTGRCNATHSVLYTTLTDGHGRAAFDADIDVYHADIDRFGDAPPKIPPARRNRSSFLFFIEPPAHYVYNRAEGFDGFVANTREATVWRPMSPILETQAAISRLRPEVSRNDIGIWIDHCYPHTRRRLIDELMLSGLPVRSYGRCRHNTGELGTPNHGVFSDKGGEGCRKHRLMLAVENNNCIDWLSLNL